MMIDRVISLSTAAGVEPVVVQQNDRESRTVRFYVYESSGVPLDVQGKTARIFFRKNSATSPAYEAAIAADGWISLTIPAAVTALAGNGEMQLAISRGSSIIHSFTIPFSVKASLSYVGETETPGEDPMGLTWDTLPGKPAVFPPDMAQIDPCFETVGNAIAAARRAAFAPNLLLNADFSAKDGIVNQRGQGSYTGATARTIDAWRCYGNRALTAELLPEGGIRLSAEEATGYALWIQAVDDLPAGDYTLAVMTDTGLYTRSYEINEAKDYTAMLIGGIWRANINTAASHMVRIFCTASSAGAITLKWVALFRGTFTADDLPQPLPTGKSTRLQECGMNYRRVTAVGGSMSLGIGLAIGGVLYCPVKIGPMRGKPTVSFSKMGVSNGALSTANVTSASLFSYDPVSGEGQLAVSTSAAMTAGSFYRVGLLVDGYIDYSAEII